MTFKAVGLKTGHIYTIGTRADCNKSLITLNLDEPVKIIPESIRFEILDDEEAAKRERLKMMAKRLGNPDQVKKMTDADFNAVIDDNNKNLIGTHFWSETELDLVREMVGKYPYKKIGQELGRVFNRERSEQAIFNQVRNMKKEGTLIKGKSYQV